MKTTNYVRVKPDLDAIEAVLLPAFGEGARWCAWRAVDTGKPKPKKFPYKTRGRKTEDTLSSSEQAGWLEWGDARRLYGSSDFAGVGVHMLGLSGIVGLDIDECLDGDGGVVPSAAEAVDALLAIGCYVEVSPSGAGLRAFMQGKVPAGTGSKKPVSGHSLEAYSAASERYLSVTGIPWSRVGVRRVCENQPALDAFLDRFGFRKPVETAKPASGNGLAFDDEWPEISDDEILKLLRTHNKRGLITRLMAGKLDDAQGDHSKADFMLCCQLASFTHDEDQIDRIFRQSRLMRPKWDEWRGKDKYGNQTIYRAVELVEKSGESHWQRAVQKTAEKDIEKAQTKGLAEKASDRLKGGLEGLTDAKGKLKANIYVWSQLLYRDRRLLGAVWFDEFAQYPKKSAAFCAVSGGLSSGEALTDDDFLAVSVWLAREWGISVRGPDARAALLAWAGLDRRNPVTARLDVLHAEWDGVARLGRWLTVYCGADDTAPGMAKYLEAVGSRWVIGCVARASGQAKVDCMLILEGRQGAGKSTAARALAEAVAPSCFLEGFELSGGKDSLLSIRGKLIGEWGELSGLSKHDSEQLKNFLSRGVDSYRDPYGIATRDFARTCCFIGSTNESTYLRDVTGNRRFWPVRVGRVNVAQLRQDAGQLWGEAVHLFRQGLRWWIDDAGDSAEVVASVTREQQARLVPDAWGELVEDFNIKLACGAIRLGDTSVGLNHSFRFTDLASVVLGEERAATMTALDERRLQTAIRRGGWESFISSGKGKWRLQQVARDRLMVEVR